MNTYFVTTEQQELYLSKFESTLKICNCGESVAYVDEERNETIIVCDSCHDNAPNIEKYF
jgi:hypothetical protein